MLKNRSTEAKPPWPQIIKIWWAITWRNMIAAIIALCLVFFLSFCAGALFNLFGWPDLVTTFFTFPLGIVIGLALSTLPIRDVIGRDLGGISLVVKAEPESEPVVSFSSIEKPTGASKKGKKRS